MGLDLFVRKMAAKAQTAPSVSSLKKAGLSPTHLGHEHSVALLWLVPSPQMRFPGEPVREEQQSENCQAVYNPLAVREWP